ncbi:MAG: CHASE2 domain-containing protein [Acidobacteria bacterium]|nr:CHASE2 domain-containing protein [Acidobacteriota bacterium]
MSCSGSLTSDLKHCVRHMAEGVRHQLRSRSRSHWLVVGVLLFGGMFAGHELGQSDLWIDLRYSLYQSFLQGISFREPYPKRVVLVLIDDQDFWNGKFEHRTPLKRDVLAELLLKIDAANPEVIALDVDLRSHAGPGGQPGDSHYEGETQKLLAAVNSVSKRRTVVLTKSIRYADATHREYVAEPSVYDNYPFEGAGVKPGYVTLPDDIRRVTLDLKMQGGAHLDSFASAIARAVDARSLEEMQEREEDALPYGTFIAPEKFVQYPAREVLGANPDLPADVEKLRKMLGFKIVIVGGAWHQYGFKRGPMRDGHASPVGRIHGAFIHANYAEALLDSRTYRPMREGVAVGIEFVFSAVLALVFSLHIRLALKFAAALFLGTFLVGVSYVSWQNLGLFFDFFVPVVLLLGHAVIDKMRGD